ncbi:hypothetical protein [Laspinema olomoucense]|uniref:hypothetical protein n=1 Tax=Laspinema olomoucense TaxID=3231600 RepID=UPI0021BB8DEE|nr:MULTISPECIES: hypothetical protein [unclassified Laspinema]MCT7973699.1 hypothetical protein [Laspinema sp. D3d]MCT7996601.1 hypothetical protein [Laspinema sp. D3c]
MKKLFQKVMQTPVSISLPLPILYALRRPTILGLKLSIVILMNLSLLILRSSVSLAQIAEIRALLPQLQRQTNVRIFLPRDLTIPGERIYVNGQASTDGYGISLGTHPQCQSNSCWIGSLGATRGQRPPADFKQVPLARGITGYYFAHPRRTSILYWVYDGVLYGIQLKIGEQEIIDIANSAIEETLGN